MGEREIYFDWLEAPGSTLEWTSLNNYTKKEMIWTNPNRKSMLKLIKFWFPTGAGGYLLIRVKLNGGVIAPAEGTQLQTGGFTQDEGTSMPIYIDKLLEKNDKIQFEFKNLNGGMLKASIALEVQNMDKKSEGFGTHVLPDVAGTRSGKKKKLEDKKRPLGEPSEFGKGF